MKKVYILSEDEYSGTVAIVCETADVTVDVYVPTTEELLANQYLYRELPHKYETKTQYIVKVYYHYELGENAYIPNSDGCTNLLDSLYTLNRNEANEFFVNAKKYFS